MTPPDVDRCVAELEQHIEVLRELRDDYHMCGPTEYSAALDAAIRALRQGGRWIPVSERLPDIKTGVLAAFEMDGPGDWRIKTATRVPGHPDAREHGWLINGGSWTPTRWRPLPAPPSPAKEG